MKITIHQLPIQKDYVFRSYNFVNRLGVFNLNDYRKVYEFEKEFTRSIEAELEDIYRLLNCEHPDDYRARSLSVSDLIEVEGLGLYYVDSYGFEKLGAR